mmetsp:Transcript_27277/g.68474  ORF Transcript_27277/g.68474 Transcript_27277/m.68474 type:complete len:303 (-) Transcript_27277:27-935(-)|eukprot:CAMPEP_0174239754 /NCGR_PEP_ID=MMETSP0417-20130205/16062_1 /TAXON_ID=242541 /ORGANISM="Mayorella sp, Strain BSH-02190019" /LENGTH=302 /DNA_ID=CAMNT_0015318733 /DNA_START=42 /DNA_END=950 /DNA_ORIENTATION=+
MPRKRKKQKSKPTCWYCEREFEDEGILIEHQRAKHFKCTVCHRRLQSASGMALHVYEVHKRHVDKVPNALPGKDSVKHNIVGSQGVPVEEKKPRLTETPSVSQPVAGAVASTVPVQPLVAGLPPTVPLNAAPFTHGAPPGIPGMMVPPPHMMGHGMMPHAHGMPGMPFYGQPPFLGAPPPHMMHRMGQPGMPPPPQHWNPNMRWVAPGNFPGQHAPPPGSSFPPSMNGSTGSAQTPASAPASAPTSAALSQPRPAHLVFNDEELSMEEKRAQQSRYRYDDEALREEADSLDAAIESRLMAMR